MRFFARIGVMFYMGTILLISGAVLLFLLDDRGYEAVRILVDIVYKDPSVFSGVVIAASGLIVLSLVFAGFFTFDGRRERTIAFDNPTGIVHVSLSALEDMVRRLIQGVPEVRDVKSHITAVKKGIVVSSRLILNTDVNIPDMTSRLQDLVARKIQDTIGIDEKVVVKIHVIKIFHSGKTRKEKDEIKESSVPPGVPFHGYRA
jgi:uncharacterized alkaline shock family protein YloU